MSDSPAPARPRRGAYLLPSAFTIGNMILGFYAVVLGLKGRFGNAAVLVFIAVVLDGLDGRIARLTGTESAFGREYDSLADVITFGVAPAFLSYLWGLSTLGRIGWLAPAFFVVCSATRLARFNVQVSSTDRRFFVGLPIPAAAGAVCSVFFVAPDPEWRSWARALLLVALLTIGSLMVSTFRYRSFKQIDLRRRWSYRVAIPIAVVLLVAAIHPRGFFVAAAFVYTVSGPAGWLWGRLRHRGSDGDGAEVEATPAAAEDPP